MSNGKSISRGCGFVVTPEGHAAVEDGETCCCTIRLVAGLLECMECGTVYGRAAENDHYSRISEREWKW